MIASLIDPILDAASHYRFASVLLALLGFIAFLGALWRLMVS